MKDLAVSLDMAALLMDTSKRTLWRRLSAGKLQRHGEDAQGRVMLAFKDIAGQLCVPFSTTPAGGGLMTWRCSGRQTGATVRRRMSWVCSFWNVSAPTLLFTGLRRRPSSNMRMPCIY